MQVAYVMQYDYNGSEESSECLNYMHKVLSICIDLLRLDEDPFVLRTMKDVSCSCVTVRFPALQITFEDLTSVSGVWLLLSDPRLAPLNCNKSAVVLPPDGFLQSLKLGSSHVRRARQNGELVLKRLDDSVQRPPHHRSGLASSWLLQTACCTSLRLTAQQFRIVSALAATSVMAMLLELVAMLCAVLYWRSCGVAVIATTCAWRWQLAASRAVTPKTCVWLLTKEAVRRYDASCILATI